MTFSIVNKVALLSMVSAFCINSIFAQSAGEALRYSEYYTLSSARNIGVGGSMYGLGGDISVTSINPAGLAQFKNSEIQLSLGLMNSNTDSRYFGNTKNDKKTAFNIPSFGLVLVSKRNENKNWRNFAFGFTMNRTNDFNRKVNYSGYNSHESITKRWLENVAGLPENTVLDSSSSFAFEEGLAANGYLIGEISPNNWGAVVHDNVQQSNQITGSGSMNDFNISFASNYKEKLFLGLGLQINSLKYDETNTYSEQDINNLNNQFTSLAYTKYLKTSGTGFGANLGILAKPIKNLRIGVFAKTPSIYTLQDTYSASMNAKFEGFDERNVTSTQGKFKYKMITPWRAGASVAGVFENIGFISAGAQYVNYNAARYDFSDALDYEDTVNTDIDRYANHGFIFNIGAEGKYEIFRIRAGYSLIPHSIGKTFENTSKNIQTFSFGVGLREENWYIDLATSFTKRDAAYFPYNTVSGANYYATSTTKNTFFALTLGLKL